MSYPATTPLYEMSGESNLTAPVCLLEDKWQILLVLPLPVLALALNLLLFFTVTMNRKKLQRQNYIYACVISTLLSNVLFLALHLWNLFDYYIGPFVEEGRNTKFFWILCQAGVVSVQFVMCGNIGALLFVVLDSTYFVGRSVNRKASEFAKDFINDVERVRQRRWLLSAKRRRALFLIALSWLIPIALIIAATVTWNCNELCTYCVRGRTIGDVCPFKSDCSRVWPPVRNAYLAVHVGLWALEILMLLGIIVSGIMSFRQVTAPRKENESLSDADQEQDQPSSRNNSAALAEVLETNNVGKDESRTSYVERDNNETTDPTPSLRSSIERKVQKRPEKHPVRLHSRIIFMITISVTFFICTIPIIASFLLDVSNDNFDYEAALHISTIFIYIYTIACPIILLKYLPNLRSALIVMIGNCSCNRLPKMYRRRSTSRKTRKMQSVTATQ